MTNLIAERGRERYWSYGKQAIDLYGIPISVSDRHPYTEHQVTETSLH